jgi:preprotein translocase subunit YajC
MYEVKDPLMFFLFVIIMVPAMIMLKRSQQRKDTQEKDAMRRRLEELERNQRTKG